MSGKGKGGRGKARGPRAVSRSARAGLTFPVGRITRYLRQGQYGTAKRLGGGAPVYLAAVLEYLCAEILELAGNAAKDNRKKRIAPRHIQLSVRNDEELNKFLGHVTIAQGGVLPNIHSVLLPKAKQAKASKPVPKKVVSKPRPKKASKPVPAYVEQDDDEEDEDNVSVLERKPKLIRAHSLSRLAVLHQKRLKSGQKLIVVESDLADIETDAVVHPTNGGLSTGGGVGNALARKGGALFQAEINKWQQAHRHMDTSQACMTGGGNLGATYVIHTHSPSWGQDNCRTLLAESVINILKLAESQNLKTIALPSIGSGNNSIPKHTAAAIILKAIASYFVREDHSLSDIFFVLFDQESVGVYKHELINIGSV